MGGSGRVRARVFKGAVRDMGELIQDLKRELREEILQGMSYERQMTDEELAQVIDGKILEQMDLESYLDYYCANLYFGNSQFDSFSTTLWRRAGEGETGKWHWEFSDATDTLGRNKVSNYSVNTYLCPGVAVDLFLQGLLKNKDFQTAFRQRMREYVEELTKEKAEEYLTPLLETYRVAVTATAERYGLRQTEEGYLADGDTIQEYFASRGEYILRYTEELITLVDQTEAPDGVQETVTESVPEE